MSKITNEGGLNPVWHRMLYSCAHIVTVGIKALKCRSHRNQNCISCCYEQRAGGLRCGFGSQ